jgi:hypothetical protein
MSKKPLVRSKKRAVHTNTKDKLSKLIVEVNSIAKELSKVKKGGGGDMSKMTGGADIFSKIIKMLEEKKDIITDLKIEYINLLIKGYITNLKDNYVEYDDNNSIEKIYPFIVDIKGIIFNDKEKLLFDDDNTYIYHLIDMDNPKPNNSIYNHLDSKYKDKIIKLARILNIFIHLFNAVDIYTSNTKLKTPENCILNYFTKNLNKILLSDNGVQLVSKSGVEVSNGYGVVAKDENIIMKIQRNLAMSKLKNDLIEKIFEYVKNSESDSNESIKKFKNLYNSINNKSIYGYDFLKKDEINYEEITKIINKLTKIKLTYDILNFIYLKENVPQYGDKFSFDNDKEKQILGKKDIDSFIKLREAIKGFDTIKIVDKDRTTERNLLEKAISSIYKNKDINTILQDIKEKNDSIKKLNDSKDTIKEADLKKFNKKIFDLNDKIRDKINELNNIKERVIETYYKENKVENEDEKNRIANMFNKDFYDKLFEIGIKEKDLKQFLSNDTYVASAAPPAAPDDESDLTKRLALLRAPNGGKLVAKYKSTGESTYILYKKKKIKRCVYEKTKGRGKYCKIDGEYKLLSKLKIM